ncbi:protein FAM83A [Synchiropus splendidus]|uniref:protein FAM83A n=1 Tax=Synchiropus splendidus TaxID=270530 RepID=UPI00237EAEEF|nr:protein FAM83A [Synchiropus splendidus]
MRSKPTGKLKRRIQDLRIPSLSCREYLASRPPLDLSHNESARLAVDSLLSCGMDAYHEVLNTEGEVDFLSRSEKAFIQENGRDSHFVNPGSEDEDEDEDDHDEVSELESALSETTIHDPPSRCEADQTDVATGDPGVEVYLQSDGRAASMKDVVREFIRKAKKDLVIATDSFSDVELLCDLLEASGKRHVRVHLLLDHLNRSLFTNMWQELQLKSSSFPASPVQNQTYDQSETWVSSSSVCMCVCVRLFHGVSHYFCGVLWKQEVYCKAECLCASVDLVCPQR